MCWDFHNKRPLSLRYVLVTVGPVFTEEMWRLACCALQDAFSATLEPVKVQTRGGRERERGESHRWKDSHSTGTHIIPPRWGQK